MKDVWVVCKCYTVLFKGLEHGGQVLVALGGLPPFLRMLMEDCACSLDH